jgi:hypothetical protein
MIQKTLDGFDFEVISTLKQLRRPDSNERIAWSKICINPRTKKGESLTAYFSRYLTAGFSAMDVVDNLKWELQKKGIIMTYEHERRLDIALSARPAERKTYIKPVQQKFRQMIRQIG